MRIGCETSLGESEFLLQPTGCITVSHQNVLGGIVAYLAQFGCLLVYCDIMAVSLQGDGAGKTTDSSTNDGNLEFHGWLAGRCLVVRCPSRQWHLRDGSLNGPRLRYFFQEKTVDEIVRSAWITGELVRSISTCTGRDGATPTVIFSSSTFMMATQKFESARRKVITGSGLLAAVMVLLQPRHSRSNKS